MHRHEGAAETEPAADVGKRQSGIFGHRCGNGLARPFAHGGLAAHVRVERAHMAEPFALGEQFLAHSERYAEAFRHGLARLAAPVVCGDDPLPHVD